MATKKKGNKAAGKTTVSKVARKGKLASSKKPKTSKGAKKVKTTKIKKVATPKKSKAKSTKSASSKKKLTAKKTSSKSARVKKTAPSTSKGKVAKKIAVSKAKTKKKVTPAKNPVVKKAGKPKKVQAAKAKTSSQGLGQLSPSERYNMGGLCACVIETFTKEGQGRLKRVVTYLGLSAIEKANLVRVSQGLRIPKLFADGLVGEETRRVVLKGLAQFAKTDDPSGKRWKSDLEDFAKLLGA